MKLPTSSDYPLILHGDCVEQMRLLPDNSVDAVVTDPPYGLEFMGKEWDSPWKTKVGAVIKDPATERGGFQDGNGGNPYSRRRIEYGRGGNESRGFQEWCETWLVECLRVLKPGGHLLAFGGTRTWHRLACAVEDAGFEIRDSIAWMYGSGFPKSLNVGKAIDKAAGATREVVGSYKGASNIGIGSTNSYITTESGHATDVNITTPATAEAQQWEGWGTALKPAFEPIVVARKPLSEKTVAANVLAHGTGGLNIDATRIGTDAIKVDTYAERGPFGDSQVGNEYESKTTTGRWPANVVLDEYAAAELDQQSGTSTSRIGQPRGAAPGDGWGMTATGAEYADSGGASRFFYTAKANQSERPTGDGEAHPTVKPLSLMQWLIQLVTPPGGIVLEPFAGSGTTVEAAIRLGVRCVAIERDTNYLPLIEERIQRNNLSLFGGEPA